MTKDRLDIGRQVYEHLLTKEEAARESGASIQCIYVYVREYMRSIGIEPPPKGTKRVEPAKDYRSMTKDELINKPMLKDIEVARSKKATGEWRRSGKESSILGDASSK